MGWVEFLHAQEIFCPRNPPRPALRLTQPSNKWAPEVVSPGVSKPGREAGHSTPSSTMVENEYMCTSLIPIFVHDGQVQVTFHSGTCEHYSLLGCDAV